MRKKFLLLFLFSFSGLAAAIAQPDSSSARGKRDSTTLYSAFRQGKFNGFLRYYFSHTQNQAPLTDYFANAGGLGLRYETKSFHGFRLAAAAHTVFNLGSSDLVRPDSLTGQPNRYELALFDVEDPSNRKDIHRLEELYVRYNFRESWIAFGRQLINTPLINLQDGRMRPTAVEGAWFNTGAIKKLQVEGGWLYAISPRGTTRWFDVGESIGLYPQGVSTAGKPSDYYGRLESKGVFMLGVTAAPTARLKIQVWDLFTENMFNIAMFQADLNFLQRENSNWFAGVQAMHEDAVGNGGSSDPEKTFIGKGEYANTAGGRIGWKNKWWELSGNYNCITGDGRFLIPREWGREPFYTFLPRERNEGMGDVNAYVLKVNYTAPGSRLKTSLAGGYYEMPDVKNVRLNKYGMPSYMQVNVDLRYSFGGVLKGLEAQLLALGKIQAGETYGNPKFVFNKVNMSLYNFVLNYRF